MNYPTNEPPYIVDQITQRVQQMYQLNMDRALKEDRRLMLSKLPIPHKQDYDIDHQGNLMYIGDYNRPISEKYDWHNPIRNGPIANVSQPVIYGNLIQNDGYRYPNVRIEYDQDETLMF